MILSCLVQAVSGSGCNIMSKRPFGLQFKTSSHTNANSDISSYNLDFLPVDFEPSEKDIICGRARENFHHGKDF